MKFAIAVLAAVWFSVGLVSAQVPDHNLSEWKLGDHLLNEKVSLSSQKGRVVAIEYWGTR